VTANSAATEITTHKIIPYNKGFTPTALSTLPDKPAPIKNNVSVNPVLATVTSGYRGVCELSIYIDND
jgi:hypothetical protein